MGARGEDLARDVNALSAQLAHEFFHTWSEVHLRPASWIGVRHVAPKPTGELWWSEGVTLFYADLLLRRAALPTGDSTRLARLGRLITNHLVTPSDPLVWPEATTRAFNRPATATGDCTPSRFTQGEPIGMVLDLMIRGGSGGTRSLDDAMRALSQRFTIERDFRRLDVEDAVAEAYVCDADPFSERYARRAGALDLDRWLGTVGLRLTVTWATALATDGTPAPDVRFSASACPGDSTVRQNDWFPTAPTTVVIRLRPLALRAFRGARAAAQALTVSPAAGYVSRSSCAPTSPAGPRGRSAVRDPVLEVRTWQVGLSGSPPSVFAMNHLLRFAGSVKRDPAISAWMDEHSGELGTIARHWFDVIRACGKDVRELLHDGHPTACIADAAFAYVNAFTAHVNVGFFRGAELADPTGLLEGTGKHMRHVKLRPAGDIDAPALRSLIDSAYTDMKRRLEAAECRVGKRLPRLVQGDRGAV